MTSHSRSLSTLLVLVSIVLATLFLAATLLGARPAAAAGAEALTVKPSPHDVAKTVDRLEAAVKSRGAVVVAKVDHAAAAQANGLSLRPTVLVLFGNPKLGTPLMQSQQTAGLDLPLRVLIWQDAGGATQVGYTPAAAVAARHGITDRNDAVERIAGALAAIVNEATTP